MEAYIRLSLGNIANKDIDELAELLGSTLPIKEVEDKDILTKIHELFTSDKSMKRFGNTIVIVLIHISNKKRNLYNLD